MTQPINLFVFTFLFEVMVLSSCTSDRKIQPSNIEFGNIPQALIDSLRGIRPELQKIEIDPSKDNVVKGKNGTVLYVQSNSFITDDGEPATGKVIIELKEHSSLIDFITSNLQTIHDNDILQTKGMIYLAAKSSDGENLKIDPTKSIRIEIKILQKEIGDKIFLGERKPNGSVNWGRTKEESKYLVQYPIRYVSWGGECTPFFGITKDTLKIKKYYLYDDLDKYKNTFLATREFSERYTSICNSCSKEILKIYVDNIDKNLWEADELATQHLVSDSIAGKHHFSSETISILGGLTIKEFYHLEIQEFKAFADQKLTRIDPTKKPSDSTMQEVHRSFIAFDAINLGWVNVDRFYNDPKSEKIKLIAKTNEQPSSIYLIFPVRNVILSGFSQENNIYAFTENKEGYNKLPKGEEAIIIAINLSNDGVHFAMKDIKIGQSETENIELKLTTSKAIEDALKPYSLND
jgi:hypothetical protein